MSRPTIVALGTISLDTVEDRGTTARDVLGGSAPYFAAAARAFCDVEVVGVAAEDFPEGQLQALRDAGVGVDAITRYAGDVFRWQVRYERDGSRETLAANREAWTGTMPMLPASLRDPRALFLGSTDPGHQAAVLAATGTPELVVLDTTAHWIRERRAEFEILTHTADVVLLNEDEARLLGGGDHERGVRPILDAGCSWVVVKRGEEGAIAFGHDRAIAVTKARAREVVDPTGAGDAFAGGVVAALAESWPDRLGMEEAMARGAGLASLAIESFSVDRLLSASEEGAASRVREVRTRVRKHRPEP